MACVSSIPDEVLVSEILVRLPASCVLRLRSVCRSWRRLTTEPSFLRAHTRRLRCRDISSSAEPIVYQPQNGRTTSKDGAELLRLAKLDAHVDGINGGGSSFTVRTIPGPSGSILRLLTSCDGLLCFQPDKGIFKPIAPYYVCNPVTGIWTTVAWASVASSPDDGCLCGFYFHRPTEKYRLLRFLSNFVRDHSALYPALRLEGAYEVATVGGDDDDDKSWRSIGEIRLTKGWDHPADDFDSAAVLGMCGPREPDSIQVNGSLHWLHSAYLEHDKLGIVVFDTETEKFSLMSAPNSVGPPRNALHHPVTFRISKIGGNLCVCRITEVVELEEIMELWMLKDYAKLQWVKLHTIQRRHGFVKTVVQGYHDHDDDVVEEVDGEGELLVRWGVDRFDFYNFKLKTHKPIKITWDLRQRQNKPFYPDPSYLIYYTESLVDPRTPTFLS